MNNKMLLAFLLKIVKVFTKGKQHRFNRVNYARKKTI